MSIRRLLTCQFTAIALFVCLLTSFHAAIAQEEPPAAPDPAPQPAEQPASDPVAPPDATADSSESAADQFKTKLQEWKDVIKSLRDVRARFQIAADASEAEKHRETWHRLVEKGRGLIPQLRETGIAAYRDAPNVDRELARFLHRLAEDAVKRDSYDEAYELGKLLIDNGYDTPQIYTVAGIAAFATHHFDDAKQFLQTASDLNAINDVGEHTRFKIEDYLAAADDYKKFWEEEQQKREQDASANLPRIKLQTTKGDIVIELFEDEAPETVGNFVHLVEEGYYNGTKFHRVLPGFMAQGGDPKGDGSGGPGYEIYDEFEKEGARKHFRGTLSMANTGRPNTGGSQFFLTFLPTAHLNGRHTVFGRVVEGMDVLPKIQRVDPSKTDQTVEPDKIVKAEVLSKREHEYQPTPVKE